VIDLKEGQVVRGIAGRRHEYQPLVSRLTSSCRPLDVALALREHFGLTELYLADLDAIAGVPPARPLYAALRGEGFRLWIDAGIRAAADVAPLAASGIERIVVGLETIQGPDALAEMVQDWGPSRIVFSLDLKEGQPLGNRSAWNDRDAVSIAAQAIAAGVCRLILLDLARVGLGAGTGTEPLLTGLAAVYPEVGLIAGGGVRDIEDLHRLQQAGARGVLVASALHDGRLQRGQLDPFL
jgi:phosphoribosylformimino-5-aminoimidazole carboxamide ribotide isomerase